MSRSTSSPATEVRRFRSDQGAALVETALISPVFFLLIFGIIEFGLIYRDYLTVGDAAAGGARSGSIVGPGTADVFVDDGAGGDTEISVGGDFAVVKALRENLVAIPVEWIDKIVIFRVEPDDVGKFTAVDLVPDSCRSGASSSDADNCNVYEPRDAFLALEGDISSVDQDFFECIDAGDPNCGWPNDERCNGDVTACPEATGTPDSTDIDYLGVYVKLDRPYLTGIFGDDFTIEQAYILRIEAGDF